MFSQINLAVLPSFCNRMMSYPTLNNNRLLVLTEMCVRRQYASTEGLIVEQHVNPPSVCSVCGHSQRV